MDIGRNADGDYIIDGRLYTEGTDGRYHFLPLSMDEARMGRPNGYEESYSGKELKQMLAEQTKQENEADKSTDELITDSMTAVFLDRY